MMALSLLAGFGLLLLGGELLVTGSVGIAHRLRISKVVIGLTLVAFATSAPELIVSVVAALKGKGCGTGVLCSVVTVAAGEGGL